MSNETPPVAPDKSSQEDEPQPPENWIKKVAGIGKGAVGIGIVTVGNRFRPMGGNGKIEEHMEDLDHETDSRAK